MYYLTYSDDITISLGIKYGVVENEIMGVREETGACIYRWTNVNPYDLEQRRYEGRYQPEGRTPLCLSEIFPRTKPSASTSSEYVSILACSVL